MNLFEWKQTKSVAKFLVKKQLLSISYWNTALWPVFLAIFFLFYYKGSANFKIPLLSQDEISLLLGKFTPDIIFILSVSYVGILATEVANDKTTRIMEMLLSMTSAKVQLLGKILGTYLLLTINIVVYAVITVIWIVFCNSDNLINDVLNPGFTFYLYLFFDIAVGLFISLMWTAELASFVTDKAQVASATIPVLLLLGTGTFMGMIFSTSTNFGSGLSWIRILANIVFAIPPIGTMIVPTLVVTKALTFTEAFVNVASQLVLSLLMLRMTIRQYGSGVVSYSHRNPFLKALEHENELFEKRPRG